MSSIKRQDGIVDKTRATPLETSESLGKLQSKLPPGAEATDLGADYGLAKQAGPANRSADAPLPKPSPASEDTIPPPMGVLKGAWGATLDFLRGSSATRETNRSRKIIDQVNELEPSMRAMSDADLQAQTGRFREHILDKSKAQAANLAQAEAALASAVPEDRRTALETVRQARNNLTRIEQKVLDDLLPEVFATVREASRRATGMRHFNVQVMGAGLIHRGLIAEMYTGEGKTLAATLAAYASALPGHGSHVVTVNDYLSGRDAEEMSAIYGFLGMSVGVLQANNKQHVIPPTSESGKSTTEDASRKDAYQADITYGTASEFAFDYLRDNGVLHAEQKVQRPLYSVLLDEIDSLLIDEARTPLIIAGPGEQPDDYAMKQARDVVQSLDLEKDAEWSVEEHWASFTSSGIQKVEEALGISDLYGIDGTNFLPLVINALKAEVLLRKDEHYTIIDGEVRTVGQSGHAYEGRRFVQGLHQAIEAKEELEIQPENRTQASITMRDFLGLYQRRGGMTGTALSARELFRDVYGFDVARVPTRKPLIRVDLPDRVFKTGEEKLAGFVDELISQHKTGRPVLIGVEYTNTAEALGQYLSEHEYFQTTGTKVQILGAKSDAEEAEIIASAGRTGAITVATARGGRGVDIKLGGNADVLAAQFEKQGLSPTTARAKATQAISKDKAKILGLGGLMVMGFEHFDSRRRDDQLRGRCARQGDPGKTVFFSALSDPLYDGYEEVEEIREGKRDFDPKRSDHLTEDALDRSENLVNSSLTQSLPYDRVASTMRQRFYDMREHVISMPVSDTRPVIVNMVHEAVDHIFEDRELLYGDEITPEMAAKLYEALDILFPLPDGPPPKRWLDMKPAEIRKEFDEHIKTLLQQRDQESGGEELARMSEKTLLVRVMDDIWSEFLDAIQEVRVGIGFRAYAQKDPKLEFITETARMYDDSIRAIRDRLAYYLLSTKAAPPPTPKPPA